STGAAAAVAIAIGRGPDGAGAYSTAPFPARRTRTWPLPSASTSARSNSAAIRASSRTDSKSIPPPFPPRAGAAGTTFKEDFGFWSFLLMGKRVLSHCHTVTLSRSQVGAQRRGAQAHEVSGLADVPRRQHRAGEEILLRQHAHGQRQRVRAQRELLQRAGVQRLQGAARLRDQVREL